jgi:kynurenine formamidase
MAESALLWEVTMGLIDLTGPITEGMWTFGPPLPEVRLTKLARLEHEGWDANLIHMGNIQGTCLETAAHLFPNQPSIDQVPLDRFFCRAAVLQLPDKQARELITVADLRGAGVEIAPGMAVLVATGWDRMWADPRFYWDSPHFTLEAMEWIAAKQPGILGVDIPSDDDPHEPVGVNKVIFGTGALLMGPLVNVRRIRSKYVDLVALPLPIVGLCGTPCRAVAIEP